MRRFISIFLILSVALGAMAEQKGKQVFTITDPDYELSPYTGLTRKHWVQAAEYLLDGAFGYIHNLDDPMYFPKQLDKTYPNNEASVPVAKLEGLARTFFLSAPLLRENPDLTFNGIKCADYYRHQVLSLVDPESPNLIPFPPTSPTQTMLELGAICLSLKLSQPVVWDTFTQEQKDRLAEMLKSYGEGPTISSNWQFFNSFILSFLKDQGYQINEEYLRERLVNLLALYRGEGWYNDVPAYDYYSMWAFQTYGPLLAMLYGEKQYPDLAEQFLSHQQDMLDNYPYMFARDGRMNMWGRSLPYRFASVAPFTLLDRPGLKNVNFGWLRQISSATLMQFMGHPDFMQDGVPTMGFYGPFAPCVQIYSCRGSVYWMGKAFFNLLMPEDSPYWTAVENQGPWETELKPGSSYDRFQPATNLMITDYPDCGGAEMRSWCHETVAGDWQKFRSSENYNKLAYHTEFPWMADGPDGLVSMNYATLNPKGEWEVLRLYEFQSYDDGVYRRDAVLESDSAYKYQLADITMADGVLRIDRFTTPQATTVHLGTYSLPDLGKGITSKAIANKDGRKAVIIDNGQYQVAAVTLSGWDRIEDARGSGLHPMAEDCAVVITQKQATSGTTMLATLHLWKKSDSPFTPSELFPDIRISEQDDAITVTMADGSTKKLQ